MEEGDQIAALHKEIQYLRQIAMLQKEIQDLRRLIGGAPKAMFKCSRCGDNNTHDSKECFALKRQALKAAKKSENFSISKSDAAHQKALKRISTVADTGTTDFMVRRSDATAAGINIARSGEGGLVVKLPNHSQITSVAQTNVRISGKEHDIHVKAHVFEDKDLVKSLGSISALTNEPNNCDVVFTAGGVEVRKNGHMVLQTAKKAHQKLWNLDFPVIIGEDKSTTANSNLAIRCDLDADFVSFWHATFGSPTVWTFSTAVARGYFDIPRLTAKIIRSNAPNSVATAKGHLDRTRQGQQSTKKDANTPPASVLPLQDEDVDSPFDGVNIDDEGSIDNIYTKLVENIEVNSSDLSGRFPITSRSGYSYFLVSIFNAYIHYELMRSRTKGEYVRAFKATFAFFRERGGKHPRLQRLDNEKSHELESFFKDDAKVVVEYVTPGNHRSNLAERAMRDAKNHLIAVLSTTDPSFPTELYDELIPQAEITLNHLRPSKYRPSISAYEGLHGKKFDFSAHPIAPGGVKVLVFEPPDVRGTFATHGLDGFYLGPALDHYRCFRCWVVRTQTTRITDTLAWFTKPFKMPGASPIEQMHAGIKDLTEAMKAIARSNHIQADQRGPFIEQSEFATTALREMAALFRPPGLEFTDAGAVYPARRAHPPPPPPLLGVPLQRVGGQERDEPPQHAQQQAGIIDIGGVQRVDKSATALPQPVPSPPPPPPVIGNLSGGDKDASETGRTVAQKQAVLPDHALRPNQAIPVVANREPSRPGAVTRQSTRQHHAVAFAVVQAKTPTIPQPVIRITEPPPINQIKERFWALNLDAGGQPLKWRAAVNGINRERWLKGLLEEFIRLVRTTKTMLPILLKDIPKGRRNDITYFNPQCREKLIDGEITFRVRGAAGGDKINFDGPTTAQVADMCAVKILINSVVSDKAKMATADIKDFYLGTPLNRP